MQVEVPAELYWECHVTLEPVFDERREELEEICRDYGFRAAKLLMVAQAKRPALSPPVLVRSDKDSFCTARDSRLDILEGRMRGFSQALMDNGFTVWRRKIELAVIDERIK